MKLETLLEVESSCAREMLKTGDMTLLDSAQKLYLDVDKVSKQYESLVAGNNAVLVKTGGLYLQERETNDARCMSNGQN